MQIKKILCFEKLSPLILSFGEITIFGLLFVINLYLKKGRNHQKK